MTTLVPSRDNPEEPVLRLAIVKPTLDSLALLVELADHISCDGSTPVDVSTYPDEVSVDMVARYAWIPPIDWEAEQADGCCGPGEGCSSDTCTGSESDRG